MSTQTRLDAYLAAELQVLKGQRYSMAGRDLTLADLAEIRAAIARLQAQVHAETAAAAGRGGLRYSTAVFCKP